MFRRLFQSVATAALRRKFTSLFLLHMLVVGAILLWPQEQTALQAAPTAGDSCVDASASPLVGTLPMGPIADTTVGQTDNYDLPDDVTNPTCAASTTGTGAGPAGSLPRGAIYTGTGTAPDRAFSFTTNQSCTLQITMDPTGAEDLALMVYQSVCSSSLNDCVVVDDTGVGGGAEQVSIDAIGGTEYFIVVDGYSTGGTPPGPSGPFTLAIAETTATGCQLTDDPDTDGDGVSDILECPSGDPITQVGCDNADAAGAIDMLDPLTICGLGTVPTNQNRTFNTTNPLVVNIQSTGTLECVKVAQTAGIHPQGTTGGADVSNNWYYTIHGYNMARVQDAPNGSFNATVTLPTSFTATADSKACRYTGSAWDCGGVNSGASAVQRAGVTTFSDWSAGEAVGPTAVSFQTIRTNGAQPIWVAVFAGILVMLVLGWLGHRALSR